MTWTRQQTLVDGPIGVAVHPPMARTHGHWIYACWRHFGDRRGKRAAEEDTISLLTGMKCTLNQIISLVKVWIFSCAYAKIGLSYDDLTRQPDLKLQIIFFFKRRSAARLARLCSRQLFPIHRAAWPGAAAQKMVSQFKSSLSAWPSFSCGMERQWLDSEVQLSSRWLWLNNGC